MTARPTSSLVTQDVVFMAAVRALPVDLLRALQEAELCDPGILLAYPRGSAESLGLAPQSSGRRIVSKSQGAQSRPDPTHIDGMHAMGIDTGTGGIVSYPIVSIVSYPVGGSAVTSQESSCSPVPGFVVGSVPVVPLSVQSDQASGGVENLVSDHGQMTAQRCEGLVRGQKDLESESGGSLVERLPHDGQETAQRSEASSSALLPSGQEDAKQGPRMIRGVKKGAILRISRKPKNSREGRQSASQPDEFLSRAQALISGATGGLDLSFEPPKNSRGVSHSGWRGDEFSPRVDAPISATSGQVLSFTRSGQGEQTPANHMAEAELDACLLYRTLVKDGAIPEGWEPDFVKLMQVARQAGDRQLRAFSQVKNEDASVWLHEYHEKKAIAEMKEKQEAAQFMAAWEMKPRRYKTKFQRSLYAGPTARRDAEEAERTRWIHELSLIVSGTPTPMGALLAVKPGNVSMLGAGLRASTLRSRVRLLKKFFSWLVLSHRVVYPLEIEHYTDCLKAKLSEP